MKVLCVAEKPSISKGVSNLLSNERCNVRNTGNQYIKNYCFEQTMGGQRCQVVMTAVMGHIKETQFRDEVQFKNWTATPIMHLFDAETTKVVKNEHKEVANNIRKEARYAQMLVIWTDCDLEGENIGAEVMEIAQSGNPRIQVKRARFSVIQEREIYQAWNNLVPLNMRLSAAVDARSELDLRVGAVFSRFQTLTLKAAFASLREQRVISYGPCQVPTLAFIVERYMKFQRFIPEDFWKINLSIAKEGSVAKFEWTRDRLFDQHLTLVLYELCMDNPMATVVNVLSQPKSKWAPLPLTTVEMQKAASRFLRINSDRVMSVSSKLLHPKAKLALIFSQLAEGLYQRGILSYPRTETDIFADNFELEPLVQAQTNDPTWGNYARGLVAGKFVRPRKGRSDDKAHPPIHPVKGAADLQGDEKRLYEFITRRFLACCSKAATGHETVVTVDVANERFTAKGLSILERNYLEVYPYDKWSDHTIPNFVQGERIMPAELKMTAGKTTAPDLLTEADLIGLMEKSGIGTDATIHQHIKTVQDRDYANKEGQYFVPSILGMALICTYEELSVDLSLHKPYLRSLMESNMKRICDGTRTKDEVVEETKEMYREAYMKTNSQKQLLIQVRLLAFVDVI
ncbi:DNA topoisomerase [Fimicolochytrium jonesii]|uniref:DNA topoisomerase n=1 Tax=Fimicolochytrium jonesii TaxID=1396493 RepID=UPI0022FF1E26|nr:DNA topoisomerase [Fimicolochytrium jonesii]KAI8823445.1 DNA topoisomerase [Fimicolochytrium jonesii]